MQPRQSATMEIPIREGKDRGKALPTQQQERGGWIEGEEGGESLEDRSITPFPTSTAARRGLHFCDPPGDNTKTTTK